MTAPADITPSVALPGPLRRFLAGPAEGWLTLVFVLLMALAFAWSLDDAAWVLGEESWGDFYASAAVIGGLLAFVGAKAGWSRWLSHLIGAAAAAIIVPLLVGMVLLPDGASIGELYQATAASLVSAWADLLVRPVTTETGHHLLAIGLLAWSVGQFSAFAVFGHRRPLDAVIVVGVLLIGHLAMTANDQLPFLVIFSIAALGLLARAHAFEEQTAWVRRRIGDASAVRALYLRGGSAFIALAVLGSLVLTATASSDPLAGAWDDVSDRLVEISQGIQRYLPGGGNFRDTAFGFGSQATITGQWSTSGLPSAVVRLPAAERERFYWRAVVFDRFDFNTWTWSDPTEVDRTAGTSILLGEADDPRLLGARREVRFTVTPSARGIYGISPADPDVVSMDSELVRVGDTGFFGGFKLSDANAPYEVVASVHVVGDEAEGGITENRLRAAGVTYPQEVRARYLTKSDAIGAEARAILAAVKERARSTNPYDLAAAMESYLRSPANFEYNPDVRGLPGCLELGPIQCFAVYKQGYCLHFATTMAMLLREEGIPTRLAEGYLPGTRTGGREQLKSDAAHAWVEVYFPRYGWVRFDPTGGAQGSQASNIPEGSPVPVTPSPTIDPLFTFRDGDRGTDDANQGGQNPRNPGASGSGSSTGLLIAVAVVLLVGVIAAAFIAWERGPRGELSADTVWRGIARSAARFGFGPRPNQTVYEYAGTLGEVLPASKPELQTVATAKVEVAYGRRALGDEGMRSLRDASRRLRLAILRLAFRRRERRNRRSPRQK